MKSGRVLVLCVAVAFAVIITVSLASADYVLIKDKRGVCKVIQSAHKTPKTIAGPFKTMEEARSAEAKECPAMGRAKERESGASLGVIKERSKQRDERYQKAREEKERKAKQKEPATQTMKQKQEQSTKQKPETAKPRTDQKDQQEQEKTK